MNEPVRIQLMGAFTLYVDGQPLGDPADRSKKGAAFLQYLIMQRGEAVPVTRLIETLWGEEQHTSNPENALKTLVSRLRATLEQRSPGLGKCIVAQRGAYRFQPTPDLGVDLYDVEDLLDQLTGPWAGLMENRESYEMLLTLYGEGLLRAPLPDWAVSRAGSLKKRYLSAVHTYLSVLGDAGDSDAAQRVCRAALLAAAGDEGLQTRLAECVRADDADDVWEPGPKDKSAYYAQVAQVSRMLRDSLEEVSADIGGQDAQQQGALVCEYAVFKEIYALHMRNLERLGATMYLGLIMVSALGGVLDTDRQESVMREMASLLQENLRKGDTISQMNSNTFALLLPTVSRGACVMVMERIKHAFSLRYPGDGLLFAYRVGPIAEYHPLRKGKGKNIC